MMAKYSTEKTDLFCDYLNTKITMTTRYSIIAGVEKPIEKRCSKWEECKNRESCKYGKI